MARKIRILFALAILVLSMTILVWGLWPEEREMRIQPIQPTQMQLPTPVSYLPVPGCVDWV